jgi:hypothetical protein
MAELPGITGFAANPIVGLPDPFPLSTEVWFGTAVISTGDTVVLEPNASKPEPVALARACAIPVN